MNIYKKYSEKQLSTYLFLDELACKCDYNGCNFTLVDDRLIDSFKRLRISCGNRPLTITSGFRCQRHNSAVGGRANSKHMWGMAIDLVPYREIPLEEFEYRARTFFDKVIPYKEDNFIHCQVDPEE